MRERIAKLAQEMGYVPNVNARRLISSRSDVVAVVLPGGEFSHSGIVLADRGVAEALGGMESVFRKEGIGLLLVFNDENFVGKRRFVNLFKERSVDGLIVWGARGDESYWNEVEAYNAVMINSRNLPDSKLRYVGHDNFGAAKGLAEGMIRSGRRKIAYLDRFAGISLAEERFSGYRAALSEAGVPFDERICFRSAKNEPCRIEEIIALKKAEPSAYDAIQCANDALALTCGVELRKLGLRIPKDVALSGGDRIEDSYAPLLRRRFPIRSFRPDCQAMGRKAAEWILEGIGESAIERKEAILPVDFVEE
jgi:LacI family transcriptional regulator